MNCLKLHGFEMEFAIGCPAETPCQFKHKEDPAVCSKLDSSEIHVFERPFGDHKKMQALRYCTPERGFVMKSKVRVFEDLVAIPGFEPGSAP
jgi:hypothetical protein